MRKLLLTATLILAATGNTHADGSLCEASRGMQFAKPGPSAYDPHVTLSTMAGVVYRELTETLLIAKQDGGLIPMLAESYEIDPVTNSIHITLDRNCGWSDGEPVKAEDFVLSFQRLILTAGNIDRLSISHVNGAREIADNDAGLNALGMEITGPYSFRVDLQGSPSEFIYSLGSSRYAPRPSHLMSAEDDFSPLEISSGPFMAHKIGPEEMVFIRNPHHCRKIKSNIERVRLTNINDRFEEYSRLLRGDFDMMLFPPEQQLARVKNGAAANLKSVDEPSFRQVYLMINPLSAPDISVRRAISLAVDREAVAGRGNLDTNTRALAETLLHKVGAYEGLPYDKFLAGEATAEERLAEAKALMEAAGYSEANPYKITISTYPLEIFESTAQFIAGMLHQAYFDVTYLRQPSVADAITYQGSAENELFVISWQLDYPSPVDSIYGIYNSTLMRNHLNNYASSDETLLRAAAIAEDSFNSLVNTYETGKQLEDLRKFEENILSMYVYVPLFNPVGSYIISRDMYSDADYLYLRMADYSKRSCPG